MERIGQRQVGYRLENGEPFVVTWHVANVSKLIISTESLMANIEVRHAKNESSMVMDRCSTRSSVVLHKFEHAVQKHEVSEIQLHLRLR